jgi:hypothetical protein
MPFRMKVAPNVGAVNSQISDLACRLWEARGRPVGSPDADWLLAERLVNVYLANSPFDEFIQKAITALNRPTLKRGVRDDAEYARVMEERRYSIDVLDRVEMLAFAEIRLNELSQRYRSAKSLIDSTKRPLGLESGAWDIPDEVAWQTDWLALESQVLTSFVYYELTSLAHMLKALRVHIPKGELLYLVKGRDKFLAHPVLGSRVRNAHGTLTIPQVGILHAHALNVDETDPILVDYYRAHFAAKNEADEKRLRDDNESLILSSKKNKDFSLDERLRLKAFGMREPKVDQSIHEMAMLLAVSALPEIQRIAAQPIPVRR